MSSRRLSILAAFDSDHPTMTLSEISTATGLAVSTTSRLVHELHLWGALSRDRQLRYRIGPRICELAELSPSRVTRQMHVRSA